MSSKPNDTKKKSKLKTLYFYQVVVNTKTTQRDIFTYKHKQKIPAKTLVEVDFRGRKLTGFVLREISKPNFPLKKIKPISKIIDYFPLLEEPQIKLAEFSAKYYFTSLGKTIFWGLPQIARRLATKEPVSLPKTKKGKKFTSFFYQADERQREKIFSQFIENESEKGQILLLFPNLNHWLAKKLAKKFKAKVLDNLTRTQEYQAWVLARQSKKGVFIGSQKAVFLPFQNLRLILVNDPADPNFKQEQDPKINTTLLAKQLAKILKIKIILSGFLPDPETYLETKNKRTFFRKVFKPNSVHLVDLNKENNLIGFYTEQALQKSIKKDKKAIVFHNRLGFAKLFLCQDCGFSMYAEKNALPPALCPTCQSPKLKTHSFGLERIKYDLKQLFPEALVSIFTREKKEPTGQIIVASSAGLNLEPKFNLSIVSLLEIGLSLPDPMMAFKTFYFTLSALGKGKKKVLQTFTPEHYLTVATLHFDFEWFFKHWLAIRKKHKLFPFYKEIKIIPKDIQKRKILIKKLKNCPEIKACYELANQETTYILATLKKEPSLKLKKILSSDKLKIDINPF
ncbi:hypothetical protein J7K05_00850 [bacterium]|nr:hypothetical protein [bacterium]